jgi:imidazolonepropionase-like amidohydrolase
MSSVAANVTRARTIVLNHATVVDGTGRTPTNDATVIVRDDRIVAAGPASHFPADLDDVQVDATGCTILPGLIDTHCHVLSQAWRTDNIRGPDVVAWALPRLREICARGVTTLRDLGSPYPEVFAVRHAAAADRLVPRLQVSGRPLCAPKGHSSDWLSIEVADARAAEAAAEAQLAGGADAIKVMITGGAYSADPYAVELDPGVLASIARTAHRFGKPVAAHCYGADGAALAAMAGIDAIEHGIDLDDRAIAAMLDADVAYCPTTSVYHRIIADAANQPAEKLAVVREALERQRASIASAIRAGLRILAGSDAGTVYHPIGDMSWELELLVEAGLSPVGAIASATGAAAAELALWDVGTIERGKRADVLVVAGNASVDIRALTAVRLVLRDGVVVQSSFEALRP